MAASSASTFQPAATAYVERSDDDRSALFADLEVARAGDDVRAHFGRYRLLFLTFKDVKARQWADALEGITRLIAEEVMRHRPTIEPVLNAEERIALAELTSSRASAVAVGESLRRLSGWLHRATGERAVILVDEYDTPIHAAFTYGYDEQTAELFRNLFSGAFKDNSSLFRGVLTGILRVAKESIFSGLNNLTVFSLLARPFSHHFGFTPEEVATLARDYGGLDQLPDIERRYNGYHFGDQTICNPWSALCYFSNRGDGLKAYWVHTSSDDILRELLVDGGRVDGGDLEALLGGGSIDKPVDEHLVLRDVRTSSASIWSFLLFSGYLRADGRVSDDASGRPMYALRLPNYEVRLAYTSLFAGFLDRGLGGDERTTQLCRALLAGDVIAFEAQLEALITSTLSYHDVGGRRPEAVYQAFGLGLLVRLDGSPQVQSNREAGRGRGETAETTLAAAMQQVVERDYATALRERGAGIVHQLGAVFDGKRAWVAAVVRP